MSDKAPVHRFLTPEQVADELNVGLPQIRALLKSGELRGFTVGGRNFWRVGREDLEEYIKNSYLSTARCIEAKQLEDHG